MKYRVPGTNGIFVSKDCDFFYEDGTVCELPVYDDFVEIEMFGETRRVYKTWVKHLAVFGEDDPMRPPKILVPLDTS